MIYIVLPFLCHLVLSAVRRAQFCREKNPRCSPLSITSLSDADASPVTHPPPLAIRMHGSTSSNPHAPVSFLGCRTLQDGGSPLSPSFGLSPIHAAIIRPLDVCVPRMYVARGAAKPRNAFPSEPCFSLGHPIILPPNSQHQDVAPSWNWRDFRGHPPGSRRIPRGKRLRKTEVDPHLTPPAL